MAVWQKVQELDLRQAYLADDGTFKYIKKVLVLPVLLAEHVAAAFNALMLQAWTFQLVDLMDYVQRTWMTRRVWNTESCSQLRQLSLLVVVTTTYCAHPRLAKTFTEIAWGQLSAMIYSVDCCAIGECGLDYTEPLSSLPAQRRLYQKQMEWGQVVSRQLGLGGVVRGPKFLPALTGLERTDLVEFDSSGLTWWSLSAVVRGVQMLTGLDRTDLVEFDSSGERCTDPHCSRQDCPGKLETGLDDDFQELCHQTLTDLERI
ncbi:hypothetical protein NP493_620g01001 [Ridgeia piscesae]|uniref:Uncharacterized protein n=1 Tax=Ridgeia piscesae TaxID=27915 RepID=A0AAD9NQP6_RIDPI|nr:hypothetical protein NP493_620g01001 [Ridgeia piscesae]